MAVKLHPEATKEQALQVQQYLTSLVDGLTFYAMNKFSVQEQIKMLASPLIAFSVLITVMTLTLAFFMMIASFTQKIREYRREVSILSSIGLTKDQNNRIIVYESTCIVAVAVLHGIVIGLVTTVLTSVLFAETLEAPLTTVFSWAEIVLIVVIIGLATVMAVSVA